MAVDAVFPAASELVMLVGGALATAAFAQHVSLPGHALGKCVDVHRCRGRRNACYFAGSLAGWAIGLYGGRLLARARTAVPSRQGKARWSRALVRALGIPRRVARPNGAADPLVCL